MSSKNKLLVRFSAVLLGGVALVSAPDMANAQFSNVNWGVVPTVTVGDNQPVLQSNATGNQDAFAGNTGESLTKGENSPVVKSTSESGTITIFNGLTYEDRSPGPGLIRSLGNYSDGIYTKSVSGITNITNSGTIKTEGSNSAGIRSFGGSQINVDTSDGGIVTEGYASYGIVASPDSASYMTDIDIISGAITTEGEFAHGILAGKSEASGEISGNGQGPYDSNINIKTEGDILVVGVSARGIFAVTGTDGSGFIDIDSSASSITTLGSSVGALTVDGIHALIGNGDVKIKAGNISVIGGSGKGVFAGGVFNSGDVTVSTIEGTRILTEHSGSEGIYANTFFGDVDVSLAGSIKTMGSGSAGVVAESLASVAKVRQDAASDISTSGFGADGIHVKGGVAQVDIAGTVNSYGEASAGVRVVGMDSTNISVLENAKISGGWQGTVNHEGLSKGAGITIGGIEASLNNAGTIDALSDRAIFDFSLIPPGFGEPTFLGDIIIKNSGTITGFVELGAGAQRDFTNIAGGVFETRHFADTDGDGERDTKAVALNDFGDVNSTFANEAGAIVKLGAVTGEKTVDDTLYYQARTGSDNRILDTDFYDLNRDGIVQAQMINLGSFSNAGIIDLRGDAVGNTLVMTNSSLAGEVGSGKFTSEGGSLYLNTVLNEGLAPGGATGSMSDMLIVDETALGAGGATTIHITQMDKGGDALTGGNGIQLVEVRNKDASEAGVFGLHGDYVHEGAQAIGDGAYAYKLYHNGIGDDASDGNWYLRSQLSEEDPEEPLFTGGVPLYEAYPQLLLGLNGLPTLQQRVGNRYWNNAGNKVISQGADVVEVYAPTEEAGVLIEENGIWGRIEGSHTKIKSRVSTSGTDYDYNTFKMQAGLDGMLTENEDGKLIGGVTVHYAHGKANISSAHGDGDIKTNGYGFGGTLTWYGENGFYVDNQAQLTWYDSDLHSDTAERSLVRGNNGFGYALSVETGKRITIDENWSVTPQAQLMYSNVRFDSFTDQFNGHVSKKRADSLQGRLGISADYQNSWLNDQGMINRSYVYGIANLYNEFLNGTKVDVSGVSFTNKRERLWAGIGLGGSYNWNDDKYSVYGEGSVNTSLKNFGDSYSYKGTVGFRVKW